MNESSRWVLAAVLFGVLFYFATDKLIETPPTWFDEGLYLQAAMNDSLHGAQVLQLAPNTYASTAFVSGGFPFLRPISWSFSLFGIDLLHARIVMVAFIAGCVTMLFLLARVLFGDTLALGALALLATFPPLYGQGKNALGEVPGLFYFAIFLFALHALERQKFKGVWWYLLAGLAAGFCVVTKPIFLLLGGAVIIVGILYRKTVVFDGKNISLAFAAFLVPVLYWLMQQFAHGDTLGQVLGYYANPYGIQDLNKEMLINFVRFFHESSPMYFALLMAIWLVSIAMRVYKKKAVSIVEATAFSFAILVSLAYLRTAGWYRYFFTAEIPALVFLPNAIASLAENWNKKNAQTSMLVCVALLVLIQGYQLLFGSWVAAHVERTTAHTMQAYVATLPSQSSFFVYNQPAAVIFLPNQNYYQYIEITPKNTLGSDEITVLQAGTTDFLVTNDQKWAESSTTIMSRYIQINDIDGVIIAKRR